MLKMNDLQKTGRQVFSINHRNSSLSRLSVTCYLFLHFFQPKINLQKILSCFSNGRLGIACR